MWTLSHIFMDTIFNVAQRQFFIAVIVAERVRHKIFLLKF